MINVSLWASAGFLNVCDCAWVLFGDFQPEEDNRKGLQFCIFLYFSLCMIENC